MSVPCIEEEIRIAKSNDCVRILIWISIIAMRMCSTYLAKNIAERLTRRRAASSCNASQLPSCLVYTCCSISTPKRIEGQILHFLTAVKIRGGMSEMSESIYQFIIAPNFWYTLTRRCSAVWAIEVGRQKQSTLVKPKGDFQKYVARRLVR